TFQSLAYVLEVERGEQQPERHFGIYALYVMFYPQLVAGPIERPQNLLHQFHREHRFDADRAIHGLNRMAYGFFKKLVIADRLALYVNRVYGDVSGHTTIPIVLAMVFFSIQIYCDFSGYSDIAMGSAEVMGFDLMQNFERPFLSRSITEFWRRWHRSLSTWFNDYLFTPLSMALRDHGKLGIALALMTTFLVSGLWHGAGWTFVIYGGMHGVALVYEALTKKRRKAVAAALGARPYEWLSRVSMFVFVTCSYVFFRATSVAQAGAMFGAIAHPRLSFKLTQLCAGLGPFYMLVSALALGLLVLSYRLPPDLRIKRNLSFACAMTAAILLLGKTSSGAFIYFQF
ncbi:MAG TPA: MBOAT family O-acyltransferase, partial [Polyangiales bacterium]|nr:MBOAT family O-acyltransferase [Polyangiales bacterium]